MNGELENAGKNINGRLRDFPGIDDTLSVAGMAADAKKVGDVLRVLIEGHNNQNAEIKKLRGYINDFLQLGNILLVQTLPDDPNGYKIKEELPGVWMSIGKTIPIDEHGNTFCMLMCIGDIDNAESLQSGGSK